MLCVQLKGHQCSYTKHINHKGVLGMYHIRYVRGHIEVYANDGTFLFSADTMREVDEMMGE